MNRRPSSSSVVALTLASALALTASGCGKGVVAGASANFSMGKTTATSFSSILGANLMTHLLSAPGNQVGISTTSYYTFQAADSFGVKLIAAYLAEDVDSTTQNNVGSTQLIYLNPECNEDISSCGADTLTTFFEFNQSESALNTQLNAQGRSIAAGTYRYVRLELCKEVPTSANMRFQVQGLTPVSLVSGRCSMNSGNDGQTNTLVPMDPPITIAEGDSVQVRLEYNINRFIEEQTGQNSASNCRADGSGITNKSYCNYGYFFKPSVTIN